MMREDPVERLRRANPVRETLAAPPVDPLLDRLDEARSGSGLGAPAGTLRRSAWVRIRAVLSVAPLVAAVVTTLAIAAVAIVLLRHGHSPAPHPSFPALSTAPGLPPVPQNTPANVQALKYFNLAQTSVINRLRHNGQTCFERPGRPFAQSKPDEGSPSQAMLSAFGVLRLPAGAHRTLPPVFSRSPLLQGAFVRYIRVAQRRYGSVYEVIPAKKVGLGLVTSARCRQLALQLESTALRAEVAHAPSPVRALALRLGEDRLLDEQYTERHPEGICLFGGGGGSCQPLLYALARGGLQSTGYGSNGSIWDYLVPNGVATVTARYPAEGPKQGFRRTIPAQTVTARVINNVAVWTLSQEPGDIFPTTITWRASDGRIVKTVYEG